MGGGIDKDRTKGSDQKKWHVSTVDNMPLTSAYSYRQRGEKAKAPSPEQLKLA